MERAAAQAMTTELMAEHGLRAKGWVFAFNRRKRSLGLCRFAEKRIELSEYYVDRNEAASVRDTILHEIAHALAGPRAGHGSRWREMCLKIGATPQRLDHAATMPRGKWRATCAKCGAIIARHQRPRAGLDYRCRACGRSAPMLQFAHCETGEVFDASHAKPRLGGWRATCPACSTAYTRRRAPHKDYRYCCKACGVQRGRLVFNRTPPATP